MLSLPLLTNLIAMEENDVTRIRNYEILDIKN